MNEHTHTHTHHTHGDHVHHNHQHSDHFHHYDQNLSSYVHGDHSHNVITRSLFRNHVTSLDRVNLLQDSAAVTTYDNSKVSLTSLVSNIQMSSLISNQNMSIKYIELLKEKFYEQCDGILIPRRFHVNTRYVDYDEEADLIKMDKIIELDIQLSKIDENHLEIANVIIGEHVNSLLCDLPAEDIHIYITPNSYSNSYIIDPILRLEKINDTYVMKVIDGGRFHKKYANAIRVILKKCKPCDESGSPATTTPTIYNAEDIIPISFLSVMNNDLLNLEDLEVTFKTSIHGLVNEDVILDISNPAASETTIVAKFKGRKPESLAKIELILNEQIPG